ncbi:DUF3566 domain-containing protein [Plantactinospora endophytica]
MVSADTPSPKFTRAPGMPPPPDQLPEEPAAPSAGAAEGGKPASATTEAATAATSPAATAAASRGSAGVNRSDQSGTSDPNATTRLEQPGEAFRTERISARTERPGSPGVPAGAEATQPISGGAPQGGFRPGRPGGAAQTSATSRFGFGSPAARTATGAPAAAGAATPGAPAGGPGAVGAARVTEAVRAARSTVSSAASRGPRRARLNLKRIDPWSVMKFSFAVSLVLFIVVIVATSVLYLALDAMGVFDSVNGTLTDMISASGGQGGDTFQITAKGVILTSGLIGLVNVVLFTALATLGAFIYNVCADLVGGVELTLAERD